MSRALTTSHYNDQTAVSAANGVCYVEPVDENFLEEKQSLWNA